MKKENEVRLSDRTADCLLGLLSAALDGRKPKLSWETLFDGVETDRLMYMAGRHAVLPLLYDVLEDCPLLSQQQREELVRVSRKTVQQSYHLLFLTRQVTELLEEAGITAAVLKGMAACRDYPVPELRKSGDVDLLLFTREELDGAAALLWTHGFYEKDAQHARHHLVFGSPDGIDIELHSMLAEPFDSDAVNACLEEKRKECRQTVEKRECMGVRLPMLSEEYHAWQLMLHSLQHFLRAGFGLKLLCDWVVFWKQERSREQQEKVKELSEQMGAGGFVNLMTHTCIRYLGLSGTAVRYLLADWEKPEASVCEEMIQEVLEAEEFGKSSVDRMVGLRGTGIRDYLREFHHQMRLQYPRAGRIRLLVPFLWAATFVRFCHNNRRYQRGFGFNILRKAGKRGSLIKKMHLFEERDLSYFTNKH